jgi:exosome complex RNA-binding protein Csl4
MPSSIAFLRKGKREVAWGAEKDFFGTSPTKWKPVDYGVVVGPDTEPGKILVCNVQNGTDVVSVAADSLRRFMPLSDRHGGFRAGDIIESTVWFERDNGESIKDGDMGVVVGPSSDPKNAMTRVCCQFRNMKVVNLAMTQIRKSRLPGGLSTNSVIKVMEGAGFDKVGDGDFGIVTGPGTPAHSHVTCCFEQWNAYNVHVEKILYAPLVAGFKVGDTVKSRVAVTINGKTVRKGDIGVIVGPVPQNTRVVEKNPRICCSFPSVPAVIFNPQEIEGSFLPGNLKPRDFVSSAAKLF